jgi:hypothetical protein
MHSMEEMHRMDEYAQSLVKAEGETRAASFFGD